MQLPEEILAIVKNVCRHGEPILGETSTPKSIQVSPADVLVVCRELRDHAGLYFDMLSCLTAIDNGPQPNTLEVVYNLYSIPFNHHLAIKVVVSRENPMVDSVTTVWRTADWHEREAFDLLGIRFNGHPDLRRILLPADWDGHPLRKDYKHQEYYRSIKVEY